jgi:hypothetical protein
MKMATRVRKNAVVKEQLEKITPIEPEVSLPEEKEEELAAAIKEPVLTVYPKQEEPVRPTMTTPIKWKKIGSGGFLFNNRYIKPGQIFSASLEEIPVAFRDVIVPMEELPADRLLSPTSSNYKMVEIEGEGTYNIVDIHGKTLNEVPLEYEEATNFLKAL